MNKPLCIKTVLYFKIFSFFNMQLFVPERVLNKHICQFLVFVTPIQILFDAIYQNATALDQINGTLAGPIPIQSVVRQGCPLSMTLYALSLHHILRTLEGNLPGIRLGRSTRSLQSSRRRVRWRCNRPRNPTGRFRHHPRNRAMLRKKPPKPSSTHSNRRPFSLGWGVAASDCNRNWISRPSHDLGNHIWNNYCKIGGRQLGRSLTVGTCTRRKAYARTLCLAQRIQYVHLCLLSKI